MVNIRPSASIRKNYNEISELCKRTGEPVYLTKNGYGSMVVLSLEEYSKLTNGEETALDEADLVAEQDSRRYTHEEVFERLRKRIND